MLRRGVTGLDWDNERASPALPGSLGRHTFSLDEIYYCFYNLSQLIKLQRTFSLLFTRAERGNKICDYKSWLIHLLGLEMF